MFEKILVAIDTNEPDEAVFEAALDLAQTTQAELLILGVLSSDSSGDLSSMAYPNLVGYPFTIPESAWSAYQEQYEIRRDRGIEVLSHLQRRAVRMGVQAKSSQEFGDPGTVICDRARKEKANLVVVGTHGRRGLDEFVSGSVSSYVMHRAPCSVLIVRAQSVDTETAKREEATENSKVTESAKLTTA